MSKQTEAKSFQEKMQLKAEAKDLLLKGCYKMSMNKYLNLINMGAQGFTQREWAIQNLNLGISYQFQSKLQEALTQANRAIQIDPHYEKAYYRKIQVLNQMGKFQHALLVSLPEFIKNKQIDQLLNTIREQYKRSLGLQQLMKKIQLQDKNQQESNGNSLLLGQIGLQIHQNLYQKICEEFCIQQSNEKQLEKAQKSGPKQVWNEYKNAVAFSKTLGDYYIFLRTLKPENPKKIPYLKSFVKQIHKCALNFTLRSVLILSSFWKRYLAISNGEKGQQQDQINLESEKQLMTLCPTILYGEDYFINAMKKLFVSYEKDSSSQNLEKFIHVNSVFISHRPLLLKITDYVSNGMVSLENIDSFIDAFSERIKHQIQNTNNLRVNQKLHIANSMIRLLNTVYPDCGDSIGSLQTFGDLLRLSYNLKRKQDLWMTAGKTSKFDPSEKVTELVMEHTFESIKNDNFVNLFIIEKIIGLFPKQQTKQLLQPLTNLLQRILEGNPQKSRRLELKKTIYSNLILKIDIRGSLSVLKNQFNVTQMIQSIINQCQSDKQLNSLQQYEAQNVLLMCLNDQKNVIKLLKSPYEPLRQFLQVTIKKNPTIYSNPHENIIEVQILQLVINLLYIMVADTEAENEKQIADKMGVSNEDIHKAKRLQGQLISPEIENELSQNRFKFGQYMANEGQSLFLSVCNSFNKLNNYSIPPLEPTAQKLIKIFKVLAVYQTSKFYHTPILKFMCYPVKSSPEQSIKGYELQINVKFMPDLVKFFSVILKKCNAQILPYALVQRMTNILLWGINNGDHQLTIFQSLLSLINLSTVSGVRIGLEKLTAGLYEQNQYILHGSLELINNSLLMGNGELVTEYHQFFEASMSNKPSKAIGVLKSIIQVVQKYVRYYRDVIKTKNQMLFTVPITDYSHPHKIFGTLVSICLVLRLDKVEQLQSWQHAENMLKLMYRKEQGLRNKDSAICMFKLAVHHYSKNKTVQQNDMKRGKKWSEQTEFVQLLKVLETVEKEKWLKLKQMIG